MLRRTALLVFLLMLMCLAFGAAPTFAGDIPDAWRGDIAITIDLPPQSVTGVDSSSAHADGTVPFTAGAGRTDGKADVPYQQNNSIAGCSGTLNGTWHMSLTGDVQKAAASDGGVSLNLTDTVTSDDMVMKVHCNDQTIEMPMALPLPTLQFKLPVKDQIVQNIATDAGFGTVNASVKFDAPCAGWDFTTDERGPKVIIQPDEPPEPTPVPNDDLTRRQVTDLAAMQNSNINPSTMILYGWTPIGLPKPDDWPVDVVTNETTSRDPSYRACLFVETITVTVPYNKIISYVANDVSSGCLAYSKKHEGVHYHDAWQMMIDISREIKNEALSAYPGPKTAIPEDNDAVSQFTPPGIKEKISRIIRDHYTAFNTLAAAEDAAAAQELGQFCP